MQKSKSVDVEGFKHLAVQKNKSLDFNDFKDLACAEVQIF